jgi:hypothetical protein
MLSGLRVFQTLDRSLFSTHCYFHVLLLCFLPYIFLLRFRFQFCMYLSCVALWICDHVSVVLLCVQTWNNLTLCNSIPCLKCSLQLKLLQLHPLSADHCSSSSAAGGLAVAATRRRWTWVSVAARWSCSCWCHQPFCGRTNVTCTSKFWNKIQVGNQSPRWHFKKKKTWVSVAAKKDT